MCWARNCSVGSEQHPIKTQRFYDEPLKSPEQQLNLVHTHTHTHRCLTYVVLRAAQLKLAVIFFHRMFVFF